MQMPKTLMLIILTCTLVGCGATRTSHFNILQKYTPNDGLVQVNLQDSNGFNFGSYLVQIQRIKSDGSLGKKKTLSSTAFGTTSTFRFLGAVSAGTYQVNAIYYSNSGYTRTLNLNNLGPFTVEKNKLIHLGTFIKHTTVSSKLTYGYSQSYYVISHLPCDQDQICDRLAASQSTIKHHFPKLAKLLKENTSYNKWQPASAEKITDIQRLKTTLLNKKNYALDDSETWLFGKIGVLINKTSGKAVDLNTTREVIDVHSAQELTLVSTEHGGLYSVSDDIATTIPFPINTGRLVHISSYKDIVYAVHLEYGKITVFRAIKGRWDNWSQIGSANKTGGALTFFNDSREFEEYNKYFIEENDASILISYVNDIMMVVDKKTAEVTINQYPFTIDDVSFNEGEMITAVEYTTWIWGDTKVHYSSDMGKSWSFIDKLYTRTAPVQADNKIFYALFFEGRDLEKTTLKQSNDLKLWGNIDKMPSCKLFTANDKKKLKLTQCL